MAHLDDVPQAGDAPQADDVAHASSVPRRAFEPDVWRKFKQLPLLSPVDL
jgi:hypothetical protein